VIHFRQGAAVSVSRREPAGTCDGAQEIEGEERAMGKIQVSIREFPTVSPALRDEDGWDGVGRETSTYVLVGLPALGFVLILGADVFSDPLYGSIPGLLLLLLTPAVSWVLQRSYQVAVSLLLLGVSTVCLLSLKWFGTVNSASLLAIPVILAIVLSGLAGGLIGVLQFPSSWYSRYCSEV